jgi:proteasome accessory factor B
LPRDITFSAEETALLGLAAMVWREGTMSTESRGARIKQRALGIEADEPVLAYAPRLRVRDASFEPLNNALERNQVVRFSYLKPGQLEASVREVAPVALFQYQGRWHCSAIEPDTGARKSFLLRRIVSDITPTGKIFPPRDADEGEIALREIEEIWNANTARIRVEPHSDAAMRLRKRRGTREGDNGELLLQFADTNLLAEELASYGPEVLVLEPEQLRQAHRSRLAAVLAAHTETEAGHG